MLFELARSLRSLTRSPAIAAIEEAHRMARRRFESGGATRGPADKPNTPDFALPAGVDPVQVAMAIERKLRSGRSLANSSNGALKALQRRSDGRVVVPAELVKRLGGGKMDRGANPADLGPPAARAHRTGSGKSGAIEAKINGLEHGYA
jgi:hypothetical protein